MLNDDDYIIRSLIYECLYVNIPDNFLKYFENNADIHCHNLRTASDMYNISDLTFESSVYELQVRMCGIPFIIRKENHENHVYRAITWTYSLINVWFIGPLYV